MSRYRLPPDLQADLTWYWCEAEAEFGVCSNLGGIIATAQRKRPRHEPKADMTLTKWQRQDEAIRLMWQTIEVNDDGENVRSVADPILPGVVAPMPHWARSTGKRDSRRLERVHTTLGRMVRGAARPAHERVLFRVYGPRARHPLCYVRIGEELAPLVEFTELVSEKIATGMEPQQAGEDVLQRGVSLRQVQDVRDQASRLLEAASRAYEAVHRRLVQERRELRHARLMALLGAA